MTVEKKDNWSEALLSLKKAYPDATISIKPHGSSNPVKPEKAMPHTDLRAWQKRVFPERPPLTGATDRYNSKKKPATSYAVDPPAGSRGRTDVEQIIAFDQSERKARGLAFPSFEIGFDDPEIYKWFGLRGVSALSGLPCSHVHHSPMADFVMSTTEAEYLALQNAPCVCLQEQRLHCGKLFRRRYDTGEKELKGQLDALRDQLKSPDVACPCPLCRQMTPLQRVKDIEASGRAQLPLPRPYGAKKGVQ